MSMLRVLRGPAAALALATGLTLPIMAVSPSSAAVTTTVTTVNSSAFFPYDLSGLGMLADDTLLSLAPLTAGKTLDVDYNQMLPWSTTVDGMKNTPSIPFAVAIGRDTAGYTYVLETHRAMANPEDPTDTAPGRNAIDVYAPGVTDMAKPARVITGPHTGLTDNDGALYVSPRGTLYVSDGGSIKIFKVGSTGNVFPARTIAGAKTGLSYGFSLAATTGGTVYVTAAGKILIFGPLASGNVAPTAVLGGSATGLSGTVLADVDALGDIYAFTNADDLLRMYKPGSTGNVAPIKVVKLMHPKPGWWDDSPAPAQQVGTFVHVDQLRISPGGRIWVQEFYYGLSRFEPLVRIP